MIAAIALIDVLDDLLAPPMLGGVKLMSYGYIAKTISRSASWAADPKKLSKHACSLTFGA